MRVGSFTILTRIVPYGSLEEKRRPASARQNVLSAHEVSPLLLLRHAKNTVLRVAPPKACSHRHDANKFQNLASALREKRSRPAFVHLLHDDTGTHVTRHVEN